VLHEPFFDGLADPGVFCKKPARSPALTRRSLPKANQAPDLSTMPASTPMSRSSPSRETPVPKDVELGLAEGRATLFLTTLTRQRLP
jgi:hypothetical protein